jgi:hypothetical protein
MQFFNGHGAIRLNLLQATALANREEAAARRAGRRNSSPYKQFRHHLKKINFLKL